MAHNQFQYQQALSKQGIKLASCQSCCNVSFTVVEYHPGKSVRIYCKKGCGTVVVIREPRKMTEEELIKTAGIRWNTGDWDK